MHSLEIDFNTLCQLSLSSVKLFISYSRADAGNFARHIHEYMKDKGHDVFIDINSIGIGDPWARSIEKNISECDMFVVILTPDALTSLHIEKEVLQAQNKNKVIVPCIHEHVKYDEIRWHLQDNQGVEFTDKYELALNLYPKIKIYEKSNERSYFVPQQKTIQNISISEDANFLRKKGDTFFQLGKFKEAIEWYDKALRVDPNYVYALSKKGFALTALGKFKEAIEWCNKALEVDPTAVIALSSKGFALTGLEKYEEAVEWCNKALEVDPTAVFDLGTKGIALSALGKYKEAVDCYDKALEIDPNFFPARENKKRALEKSKGRFF